MCGEEEAQKLKTIPLSDNTVKRGIDAIANDHTDRKTLQFPS